MKILQFQLLEKLIDSEFAPVTFYNLQPQQMISELNRVETALFLQRKAVIHIVFLHSREVRKYFTSTTI